MIRRPPSATRTDTLFPYTTLFRSAARSDAARRRLLFPTALPVRRGAVRTGVSAARRDGRSEEHTSELQSLMRISYAVFCLKKKTRPNIKIIGLRTMELWRAN